MKKNIILIFVVFWFCQPLFSQTENNFVEKQNTNGSVRFGIGIGIGFFYPSAVNDRIKEENLNIDVSTGFEDIVMNLDLRASLTFKVKPNIDLSLVGEYAWGPKFFIVIGADSRYFHFDKFSPLVIAKFHKPIKSGRHSIFFAPGISYNFMKFTDYNKDVAKGNALGGRAEIGYSFNFGRMSMQPFILFDYAKAVDKSLNDFELNYSGGQIGIDFCF
jgi:hypothetical protein